MATQDDYIRTALRVPPDLHAQIHGAAKENNRTFNAEIVARLQASFDAPTPAAIVSHTRVQASAHDLALLYETTEAQMQLQQATMNLGDAKDEAFRVSVVLERRERELRDAQEEGREEAFLSVRKDAYHKAEKEFKAAQQAVMAAKNDVHAKQSALSELHMRRAAESDIPDPRKLKPVVAGVESRFGKATRIS